MAKVYTKLQASKGLGVLNTKLNEESTDLEKLVKSLKAEVLMMVKKQGEYAKEEQPKVKKDLAKSLMPDFLDKATRHLSPTMMPAVEALQPGMNELKEEIQR